MANRALTPIFPIFAAFLAGTVAVAGFSPFDLFALALAALAVLIHLWQRAPAPRAAFWLGFAFGLGFFLAGVSWVYVSMHRFGGMPAALAALATLLFCAFLALFPALAGLLQARLRTTPALRAALAIPALWTLVEWLRGWILTGFPWLSAGYAAIESPLSGYAPVAGVHAVSFACLASAGLPIRVSGVQQADELMSQLRPLAHSPRRAPSQ